MPNAIGSLLSFGCQEKSPISDRALHCIMQRLSAYSELDPGDRIIKQRTDHTEILTALPIPAGGALGAGAGAALAGAAAGFELDAQRAGLLQPTAETDMREFSSWCTHSK